MYSQGVRRGRSILTILAHTSFYSYFTLKNSYCQKWSPTAGTLSIVWIRFEHQKRSILINKGLIHRLSILFFYRFDPKYSRFRNLWDKTGYLSNRTGKKEDGSSVDESFIDYNVPLLFRILICGSDTIPKVQAVGDRF